MRYLSVASVLVCCHGGRVDLSGIKSSATINGQPVLTKEGLAQATIVGCPQVGTGLQRCRTVEEPFVGLARNVKIAGETPLLAHLTAVTDGKPPGVCTVVSDGGSTAGVLLRPPTSRASSSSSTGSKAARTAQRGQARGRPAGDSRALEITLARYGQGELAASRDDLPREAWVEVTLAHEGYRDSKIVSVPLDGTPTTVRLERPEPDREAWLLVQPPGGAGRTALDELSIAGARDPVLLRDPDWRPLSSAPAERFADDFAAALEILGTGVDEATGRRLFGLPPGTGATPWLVLRPPRAIEPSTRTVSCRLELRYSSLLRASYHLEALKRTLQQATAAARCPSGDARLQLARVCHRFAGDRRIGIDFATVEFPSIEDFHRYRGFDELTRHPKLAELYGSQIQTKDRILRRAPRVPLHDILLAEHEVVRRQQAKRVLEALCPLLKLDSSELVLELDAFALLSPRSTRWLQPPEATLENDSELERLVTTTAAFEGLCLFTDLIRIVASAISWIRDFDASSRGLEVFEAAPLNRAEAWLTTLADVLASETRTWPSPDSEVRWEMMVSASKTAGSAGVAHGLRQGVKVMRESLGGLSRESIPALDLPDAEIRRIAEDARRAAARGAAAVTKRLRKLGRWLDSWDSARVATWLRETSELTVAARDRRYLNDPDVPSLAFLHRRDAQLFLLSAEVRRQRIPVDRAEIEETVRRFATLTARIERTVAREGASRWQITSAFSLSVEFRLAIRKQVKPGKIELLGKRFVALWPGGDASIKKLRKTYGIKTSKALQSLHLLSAAALAAALLQDSDREEASSEVEALAQTAAALDLVHGSARFAAVVLERPITGVSAIVHRATGSLVNAAALLSNLAESRRQLNAGNELQALVLAGSGLTVFLGAPGVFVSVVLAVLNAWLELNPQEQEIKDAIEDSEMGAGGGDHLAPETGTAIADWARRYYLDAPSLPPGAGQCVGPDVEILASETSDNSASRALKRIHEATIRARWRARAVWSLKQALPPWHTDGAGVLAGPALLIQVAGPLDALHREQVMLHVSGTCNRELRFTLDGQPASGSARLVARAEGLRIRPQRILGRTGSTVPGLIMDDGGGSEILVLDHPEVTAAGAERHARECVAAAGLLYLLIHLPGRSIETWWSARTDSGRMVPYGARPEPVLQRQDWYTESAAVVAADTNLLVGGQGGATALSVEVDPDLLIVALKH